MKSPKILRKPRLLNFPGFISDQRLARPAQVPQPNKGHPHSSPSALISCPATSSTAKNSPSQSATIVASEMEAFHEKYISNALCKQDILTSLSLDKPSYLSRGYSLPHHQRSSEQCNLSSSPSASKLCRNISMLSSARPSSIS